MKLWEVIKALTEDPTKKFEAKLASEDWTACMRVDTGFSRYFKFEVFNGKRLIDQSHAGGAFNGNVELDLDWQLVRQPVTWQEAIQAWADGRIISVEIGGFKYKFTHDDNIFGLSGRMINLGTWYVED